MHALIIEPDPLVATSIENALRDIGFTLFSHAATEDEAFAEAELATPDLIVCDTRIMDESGIKEIETICLGKYIPVIYVAETPAEARQSNVVVLHQPFPAKALVEAVTQTRAA